MLNVRIFFLNNAEIMRLHDTVWKVYVDPKCPL